MTHRPNSFNQKEDFIDWLSVMIIDSLREYVSKQQSEKPNQCDLNAAELTNNLDKKKVWD